MITPFPHQIVGKQFLVDSGTSALLADEPRVGKTGAALLAADQLKLDTILVITTASGRAVWVKAFRDWLDRSATIYMGGKMTLSPIVIIGWAMLQRPASLASLLSRTWSLIIADESHYAKRFLARRTQSLFGHLRNGGAGLDAMRSLSVRAQRMWLLTGTPLPHSPFDIYPALRALQPERLLASPRRGWPDVTNEDDFMHRYCIVKMKQISTWNSIPVVVGGRNERELHQRMAGWTLRRTQEEVGIRPPIYEIMPLLVSDRLRRDLERDLPVAEILAAADKGDTESLEMHLGTLRRLTGTLKVPAVVEAAYDEFDTGLDRLVIAFWHRDVGAALMEGLHEFGVTGIDGSTPPSKRQANIDRFSNGGARVFLAQIEAAGEAVDLSASSMLWFAETVFVPRQMRQMSLRITNIHQKRQCFVKVATLANSIDEAVQGRLLMLWTAIRNVLNVHNGD